MKNIKVVLGIAILLLVGIFGFFVTRQKRSSAVTYVTPLPVLPSVMPKNIAEGVVLYTGEPLLEFPGHVPYVPVSRRRGLREEAARLFALHGATTPGQIITGSRGQMALMSQKNAEGIISESPLSFAFTLASYSGSFVTGDTTAYKNIAVATLIEWSLLPKPFEALLSYVHYFRLLEPHPEEQSGPGGAIVAQADLLATVDGFPVFLGDANAPTFSASFDGSNRLTKIRGFILPDVEKEDKEVKIISYQEALQRLKNGNGVLSNVSILPGSEDSFATGAIPSSVTIEKVVLGYLYSPHQEYLVPIFVFTGASSDEESGQPLITTTVVSAL